MKTLIFILAVSMATFGDLYNKSLSDWNSQSVNDRIASTGWYPSIDDSGNVSYHDVNGNPAPMLYDGNNAMSNAAFGNQQSAFNSQKWFSDNGVVPLDPRFDSNIQEGIADLVAQKYGFPNYNSLLLHQTGAGHFEDDPVLGKLWVPDNRNSQTWNRDYVGAMNARGTGGFLSNAINNFANNGGLVKALGGAVLGAGITDAFGGGSSVGDLTNPFLGEASWTPSGVTPLDFSGATSSAASGAGNMNLLDNPFLGESDWTPSGTNPLDFGTSGVPPGNSDPTFFNDNYQYTPSGTQPLNFNTSSISDLVKQVQQIPGGSSALSRLLSGTGTSADYAKLAGAGVDLASALATTNRQNQLWAAGADSRARFQAGQNDPSSVMARFQPAFDQAAQTYLRGVSAKSGNPVGLGNAPAETMKYVYNTSMLPTYSASQGLDLSAGYNPSSTGAASSYANLASAIGQGTNALTTTTGQNDLTNALTTLKNLGLIGNNSNGSSKLGDIFTPVGS